MRLMLPIGLSLVTISIILLADASAQVLNDSSASYWYEEGQRCLRNGSFEAAINSFDIAIAEGRTYDNYWDALYGKAKALYDLGRYKDGIDLCDDILNDPNGPQGDGIVRFLELDGNFYTAYEDKYGLPPITRDENAQYSGEIPENYQLAMARYDEALELEPNLTTAWNSKGVALGQLYKFDESIQCFDRAIDLDSDLAEVWNNKGVSLDWLGRHNQSMGCYDRAIELKPDLAVAWMNRASTISLNLSLFSLAQENANHAGELDQSLKNESSFWNWRYIRLF